MSRLASHLCVPTPTRRNADIPFRLPHSAEPLRTQVRTAFSDSIQAIWYTMIGIAGLGFIISLLMRSLTLTAEVDENWGLEEKKVQDVERAEVA